VRLQAIKELCRRRSGEAMVTSALGSVLNNAQQDQEVRLAAAIALAAQGGGAAARALAELVESPMPAGANTAGTVALRRTALEALGLALAGLREEGQSQDKEELRALLERQLHADALDLLVENEGGWAEHDRRLPPLQGASRGLQLAASADLALLGSGPGTAVPMLALTARNEGEALRIRTQVVTPTVWRLPLPGGEQLELVLVPGGDAQIGSPEKEEGRDWYADQRDGCKDPQTQRPLNVEAERTVRLEPFAMARHAITQMQWRAVAELLPQVERELIPTPGTYEAKGLWETHAQPGALPVDSISYNDCQEWLQRLNRWLGSNWSSLGGQGAPPQLTLPGEGQWEAACRARAGRPFHFGDVLDTSWANYDGNYNYGLGRRGRYRQRPEPVGFSGLVNRWGLGEMHGQLFEWCGDQWHPNPTGEGWPNNGQAWEGADPVLEKLGTAQMSWRLLRGGSWFVGPRICRTAFRVCDGTDIIYSDYGLRPCCLLVPDSLLDS
jgi:formylglycine-generating enzyme required for sulfatase activity